MAIFLLFAVLAGTVTKDVYSCKAIKSVVMNDGESSQKDLNDDADSDSKDELAKSPLESFFHEYHVTFQSNLLVSSFTLLPHHDMDFDDPYLESISQPPEILA